GGRTANVLCRISGDSIIAWGSMSGMGRVMVRIAMMPAHEPGSMWPGYGPDTEQDDHQAGSNAYSTLPEDRHHAVGEQAGSQQGGQRAQTEGRHQPGRYRRIALAAGPDQGAVDQATGQPAPQRAQQDSLGQPTDRQQLACVGLEMPPEATTDSLDARQPGPPVGQVQSQGDHQQSGHHPQALARAQILDQPAQAADQRAGQGIAGDAADVVTQQHPPQPPAMALLRGDRQGQRNHHPGAQHYVRCIAVLHVLEFVLNHVYLFHACLSFTCVLTTYTGAPVVRDFGVVDCCAVSSSLMRMLCAGLSGGSYDAVVIALVKT